MSELSRMLEANRPYAESFAQGDLEIVPARPVLVLTCIDARLGTRRRSSGDRGRARDQERRGSRLRRRDPVGHDLELAPRDP
jgi:hypothetical protein